MEKVKIKKIIIAIAVIFIVIVAIMAALKSMTGSSRQIGKYDSSGNFNLSSGSALPEASMSPGFNGTGDESFSSDSAKQMASSSLASQTELPATEKKIIKNGSLTLKVANADNAANDIASIAKNNGGEVFSSNFYETADNVKSGTITVKIPVANFEKTFSELKKVSNLVVRESTSGQDVTEQFVDLQSRLNNKQEEEKAFAGILNRSGSIDDVLKVTRELARVRGEIEVLQGQIKFLASQTDMSVISVNLSEDDNITISDSWRPWQIAKDAVNSLISKIQKFVNFVIVLIITVIPILILYLLLFFIIFVVGKKIYHKFIKKKTEQNNNIKQ